MNTSWGLSKTEFKFWLIWAILNCLLFLPIYLFSFTITDPIPFKGLLLNGIYEKFRYYFIRPNYDVFRLAFDFVLIFGVYYLLRNSVSSIYFKVFTTLFVLVLLLYQIYDSFFRIIYKIPPSFFNDLEILNNGFNILTDGFSLLTILGIIVGVAIVFGISWLVSYLYNLLETVSFGKISVVWIVVIIIYSATFLFRYGFKSNPNLGLHFLAKNFIYNLKGSYQSKKQLDNIKPVDFLRYGENLASLKTRPNIFVFFVESYGSLMLTNKVLFAEYNKLMQELTIALKENDFKTTSALSASPVTGGGSWLSYSSFQYGYKISKHSTFFHLLKNKDFHQYPHLFNWLKKSGYYNYRLNSLYESGNYAIPWDLYNSFYATDQWIRFHDLNYEGILYGYGPAPPDQYALNYSYHEIIQLSDSKTPYSLFFISKNSHNPFLLPHEIKENWRDWNEEKGKHQPSRFFHKPEMHNYGKSIHFQLKYLVDFINKTEGNNLFIIIGDHQPPVLESKDSLTPVHIVSKDSTFIAGFNDYGFNPGFIPKASKVQVRHEGLYSIFVRQLLMNYGEKEVALPKYKPNGIILK